MKETIKKMGLTGRVIKRDTDVWKDCGEFIVEVVVERN